MGRSSALPALHSAKRSAQDGPCNARIPHNLPEGDCAYELCCVLGVAARMEEEEGALRTRTATLGVGSVASAEQEERG